MQQRRFKQVDVFTAQPYRGNALAVVLDGAGLSDDQMQQFARWTNLSETTFLLAPTQSGADYRVRIFTPGGELPFAGHPTLGSCHAWLEAGGKPGKPDVVVQESAVGLVRIRREGKRQAFSAPPMKQSAPSPAVLAQLAGALGVTAQEVIAAQTLDNGPVWVGLLLDSPRTVLRLAPDHAQLKALGHKVGVAAIYSPDAQDGPPEHPALEVRAFAAAIGIPEDPVTGSLNASLAQWLIGSGYLPDAYVAAQGARLDRAGRVYIARDMAPPPGEALAQGDAPVQVWVGGESVTCINGTVQL